MAVTINQREFSFLLYEFLDTEKLLERPRYTEHSRDIFDSMLETANRIATDFFAVLVPSLTDLDVSSTSLSSLLEILGDAQGPCGLKALRASAQITISVWRLPEHGVFGWVARLIAPPPAAQ